MIDPNDYHFNYGISVDRYSLQQLYEAAKVIVAQGDSYGKSARHPTSILTRQILERLANELRKSHSDKAFKEWEG